MRVGIPTEVHPGERRVAATPDTIKKLIKLGFEVSVQSGAGEGARLSDDVFEAAGAEIVAGRMALPLQDGAVRVIVEARPGRAGDVGEPEECVVCRAPIEGRIFGVRNI